MKRIICVMISLVLVISAGNFAVSATPFVIPGLEWTGLDFTISPAPVNMRHIHTEYPSNRHTHVFYILPGTEMLVELLSTPTLPPGAEMVSVNCAIIGEPWVWWFSENPDIHWLREIEDAPGWRINVGTWGWDSRQVTPNNPHKWLIPFDLDDIYSQTIMIAAKGPLGWNGPPPLLRVDCRFELAVDISVHLDFTIEPPIVNTSANTATFEIENLSTSPQTVNVISTNFNTLGRFTGITRTLVTIPADESRLATVGFTDNSRILIWCADTMRPIINPFTP